MNFEDIKTAMEELLTTMLRFSGEKDEDPYVQRIENFVRESNSLRLGRQLTIAVLPRMLSASARLKYDGLSNEEKADFGLATQALAEKLISQWIGKRTKNRNLLSRIKAKMLEKDTPEDLEEAIFLAEKMEEIIKEEDEETINLIDRVKISGRNNEEESLREQIRELTIESKRQRRMIEQIGNSNHRRLNTPRNQGFSRGRNVLQGFQQLPLAQKATWTDVVENLIRAFEVPGDRELAQQEITILMPQNAEFSRKAEDAR
ncbi:hypothetical protein CRE_25859 [Caenorhabditis remanei]|uniref:Uncharacterized protein n=1 Tax=Caenorhabditis remanei TaxID=31234 RepID=E3NDR8_CAERE|nr:hypothetical protein CRE_25859 [Caenorhabditis remanei]